MIMKQYVYNAIKDLVILLIGGNIVTQFISMSTTSTILLAIKIYVGIELIRIFDNKELHAIWKIFLVVILFGVGILLIRLIEPANMKSFLTLNGFLLAGLVLKKQREVLSSLDDQ